MSYVGMDGYEKYLKAKKPLPEYMREFKQAIRYLWDDYEYCCALEANITEEYEGQIKHYRNLAEEDNTPEDLICENIESIKKRCEQAIYDVWHEGPDDAHFYIIYADGSEAHASGADIISHDVKLRMQHIVYAYYQDESEEYDTLAGDLDWGENDVNVTEDEWSERREAYFDMVQYKFNTEWARKMLAKRGQV